VKGGKRGVLERRRSRKSSQTGKTGEKGMERGKSKVQEGEEAVSSA